MLQYSLETSLVSMLSLLIVPQWRLISLIKYNLLFLIAVDHFLKHFLWFTGQDIFQVQSLQCPQHG